MPFSFLHCCQGLQFEFFHQAAQAPVAIRQDHGLVVAEIRCAASARYLAQFGSASYFSHNQPMILSDSHRRLRSLVEELEL